MKTDFEKKKTIDMILHMFGTKELPVLQSEWHNSQRGYFFGALHNEMVNNKDIYVVTADLGFGMLDSIKRDFPERFINVGAAEMCALDVSVGLALEGKIPFVYTITSFFMRAAEPIALYLKHEGIPVFMVGGGRDQDYEHDGISHDAKFAQDFINSLNIMTYYPDTKEQAGSLLHEVLGHIEPSFISLRR